MNNYAFPVFVDVIDDAEIRSAREKITGEMYYSMVDLIFALREDYSHADSSNYWSVVKHRLLSKQWYADRITCFKVEVEAKDGKRRETDFMNLDNAAFALSRLGFGTDREYLAEYLERFTAEKRTEDCY